MPDQECSGPGWSLREIVDASKPTRPARLSWLAQGRPTAPGPEWPSGRRGGRSRRAAVKCGSDAVTGLAGACQRVCRYHHGADGLYENCTDPTFTGRLRARFDVPNLREVPREPPVLLTLRKGLTHSVPT
jgi:hypothetical protein